MTRPRPADTTRTVQPSVQRSPGSISILVLGSGFTTRDRRDRRDRKVVGEKMKAKPRNCNRKTEIRNRVGFGGKEIRPD